MIPKLSKRLYAVASLVKQGAVVADVGTDHGFVPVWLCKNGIITKAIASDLNRGPLESCAEYVRRAGLCDAVSLRLSDGLDAVGDDEYDTLIIAGMGGELIKEIMSGKDLTKKHIIVNPMTHPEIVRKYFYDNGFEIINDLIVGDGRHYYSVFDAVYTGEFSKKSQADYYLGNIKDFSNKEYFLHLLTYLRNKEKSGENLSSVIRAVEEAYDKG